MISHSDDTEMPGGTTSNLYCYRCGHLWPSEDKNPPKMCPRCKSSRWDVPVMKEGARRRHCDGQRKSDKN